MVLLFFTQLYCTFYEWVFLVSGTYLAQKGEQPHFSESLNLFEELITYFAYLPMQTMSPFRPICYLSPTERFDCKALCKCIHCTIGQGPLKRVNSDLPTLPLILGEIFTFTI